MAVIQIQPQQVTEAEKKTIIRFPNQVWEPAALVNLNTFLGGNVPVFFNGVTGDVCELVIPQRSKARYFLLRLEMSLETILASTTVGLVANIKNELFRWASQSTMNLKVDGTQYVMEVTDKFPDLWFQKAGPRTIQISNLDIFYRIDVTNGLSTPFFITSTGAVHEVNLWVKPVVELYV